MCPRKDETPSVVPEQRTEELSIEKMIHDGYTLPKRSAFIRTVALSFQMEAIDLHGNPETTDRVQELIRRIQVIGNRVQDAKVVPGDFLLGITKVERRTIIETRFIIETYSQILRALNRNALRGCGATAGFSCFLAFESSQFLHTGTFLRAHERSTACSIFNDRS